jgi:hypothetical protein
MPLSRRYTPEHAPGEVCSFGLDFSFVIPVGVGIIDAGCGVQTNTSPPVDDGSWVIGDVNVQDRAVWAILSGGVLGTDYQIVWWVEDSDGNVWERTTLVLCAMTS